MTTLEYAKFKCGFFKAPEDRRISDILKGAMTETEEREDQIATDYANREMRGLRRMLKEDKGRYSYDFKSILMSQHF